MTKMNASAIIKYVHKHYRHFWRTVRGLDRAGFATLLPRTPEGRFDGLTDVEYSRLTSSTDKVPSRLLRLLDDPETQQRIAAGLLCPGLFECVSEAELDAAMNAALHGKHKAAAARPARRSSNLLLLPQSLCEANLHLHLREERVIKQLLGLILHGGKNVVCWPDPPSVGPAFLAYLLAGTILPREGVAESFLIRPFPSYEENVGTTDENEAVECPFDEALAELAKHLEIEGRPSATAILSALTKRDAVLFVLNASYVPEASRSTSSIIRELIQAAAKSLLEQGGRASVVLIGKPPIAINRMAMANEARHALAFNQSKTTEKVDFFELQWRRFCRLRGHLVPDDAGTRPTRARQYFTGDKDDEPWPSTIRMLAFLASNYRTYGYFDPTAGWKRLSAMPSSELPMDIRLHLDEAFVQLRGIPAHGTRRPILRAVRWCSTALYWLTEDAVDDLAKSEPRWSLASFKAAVDKIPHLVRIGEADRKPVYKMDMAIRALIQDQWVHAGRLGRARAHHRIAQRLYDSKDDKNMLGFEYPVEPHWGRSRMHFLTESLRHYVRSCEHVDLTKTSRQLVDLYSEPEPEAPTELLGGSDPYQVINYCFAQIYWQELNGNSPSSSVQSRKLSRQHGAYQLTGELLQLLSEDGTLGKPHPALDRRYIARYYREVAYAQLDLGDLQGAKQNLLKLIQMSKDEGEPVLDTLDHRLDLVMVLTTMDDLIAAQSELDDVSAAAVYVATPLQGTSEWRKHKRLEARLMTRQAQLFYLFKEFEKANDVYSGIEQSASRTVVNDVAHTFIATLGALGGSTNLNKAMALCLRNLFDSTSRGLHHQALGFRVALAHLFRKLEMSSAAETTLDQVSKDIQQYGCSERVYLAFLLEAGRAEAIKEGQPVRAYAVYLRRCFDRARSRGYLRMAETAGREAVTCLERLQQGFDRFPGLGEGNPGTGAPHQSSVRSLPHKAIDPQYAFDVLRAEQYVQKFSSRAEVDFELMELLRLQRLLKKADANEAGNPNLIDQNVHFAVDDRSNFY